MYIYIIIGKIIMSSFSCHNTSNEHYKKIETLTSVAGVGSGSNKFEMFLSDKINYISTKVLFKFSNPEYNIFKPISKKDIGNTIFIFDDYTTSQKLLIELLNLLERNGKYKYILGSKNDLSTIKRRYDLFKQCFTCIIPTEKISDECVKICYQFEMLNLPVIANYNYSNCVEWTDVIDIATKTDIIKNGPKISIIIPNYNTGRYVKNAICSVYEQYYKNYEIIVVDDNSRDNSKEILENLAIIYDFTLHINKKNVGCYSTRNNGLLLAKGDYFLILDSDDIITKNRLLNDIMVIKKTGCWAVQSKYIRVNETTGQVVVDPKYESTVITYDRRIIEKLGYFMNVRFGGDTEYMLRFKKFMDCGLFQLLDKVNYIGLRRSDESNLTVLHGQKDRDKFFKIIRKFHKSGIELVKNFTFWGDKKI